MLRQAFNLQRALISPVARRQFANMADKSLIRIGYVPEHYLIPLHLAKPHFEVPFQLIPFPSGTGHMITSLRHDEIDLGIGLTEGWAAGLLNAQGLKEKGYNIVGSWVQNPLRWAIVTGRNRDEINSVNDLRKHNRVGVSRIGSGSHIMAFVLASQQGWLSKEAATLEIKPLGPFKDLRDGVTGTNTESAAADFFMWEHFTTKPYFDGPNTPLKHIGEIYTPWPSWHIAASSKTFANPSEDQTLASIFQAFDRGVSDFNNDTDSAITRLVAGEFQCQYSEHDAREWLKSVKFVDHTKGVDAKTMEDVVELLDTANVIEPSTQGRDMSGIVAIQRQT